MTNAVIIHDLLEWRVTSYGNGIAYDLTHKPSGDSVFFQGDDAEQFREEFDGLTEGAPALDFSDALRVIWHDYSEIAA